MTGMGGGKHGAITITPPSRGLSNGKLLTEAAIGSRGEAGPILWFRCRSPRLGTSELCSFHIQYGVYSTEYIGHSTYSVHANSILLCTQDGNRERDDELCDRPSFASVAFPMVCSMMPLHGLLAGCM